MAVAETRENAAAAIPRFRPHFPPPNYTIQTRKVSRVAADSSMRRSRGENGRKKPRREAGCSGKTAEK